MLNIFDDGDLELWPMTLNYQHGLKGSRCTSTPSISVSYCPNAHTITCWLLYVAKKLVCESLCHDTIR